MPETEIRADREADARLLHRMVFFSDAVFAIVMTLLVLDLRPPAATSEAAVREGLITLAPTVLAFLMSFALTGVFWLAHMATARRLVTFDPMVAVANLLFLLVVTLMPFVSRLLGETFMSPTVWEVYSAALIAASLTNVLLVLAVNRDGGRLVGGVSGREVFARVVRAAAPGIAFGVGFWGATQGRMVIPQQCWVLIPVVILIGRILHRSALRASAPTTEPSPPGDAP
jgi:uncharacterized membrane protein